MKFVRTYKFNDSGMSMIEVLVSIALASLAAFILASIVPKYGALTRGQEFNSQRNAIRMMILNKLSCERTDYFSSTFSRAACNGIQPLYGIDKDLLFPGNVWGDWNVKASCRGAVWQFQVARLKPGQPLTATAASSFLLDPVTGAPDAWTDVLPPGPCSDYDGAVELFGGTYSEIGGTNICYGNYVNTRINPPSCTCPFGYSAYHILAENCCTIPPLTRPDTFFCFKDRR